MIKPKQYLKIDYQPCFKLIDNNSLFRSTAQIITGNLLKYWLPLYRKVKNQ
jgi:hypothetical protein